MTSVSDRSPPGPTTPARVWVVEGGRAAARADRVATEEPLEIRLQAPGGSWSLGVTMRTPGADFELVAGLLYSEGVVRGRSDIAAMRHCVGPGGPDHNVVTVLLAVPLPDPARLQRRFVAGSACGVCGKAAIEALRREGCAPRGGARLAPSLLAGLPARLAKAQGLFRRTGGLHAAALFTPCGDLLAVREDVGRHNALDKLVGWALLEGRLPLHDHVVMVSGRASFELVQKCAASGAPVLCAVSAPSSLAVALAEELGMTLVGFLRGERFNVYAGWERIALGAGAREP